MKTTVIFTALLMSAITMNVTAQTITLSNQQGDVEITDADLKKYANVSDGLSEMQQNSRAEMEAIVKDNGMGIQPRYFDKIFKVFTKLDSESSSSGIGLSTVKKIIEFYQGKIWLESQEKIGATFFFTIPKT